MSLYRHVQDKDDLIDAVAEHVMGSRGPRRRRRRLGGSGRRLPASPRQTAAAHPALGRILADRGLTVGPVFDQLEAVHGILICAGFTAADAVRAFYCLLTYVFGFVIWELPRVHQQPAELRGRWNRAIDALDPSDYPHLHALRPHLATAASPRPVRVRARTPRGIAAYPSHDKQAPSRPRSVATGGPQRVAAPARSDSGLVLLTMGGSSCHSTATIPSAGPVVITVS